VLASGDAAYNTTGAVGRRVQWRVSWGGAQYDDGRPGELIMLEDLAAGWLEVNCPSPKMRREFMRGLLDAERKGRNFTVVIGRNLNKAHKPYLVCGHAGELFVFQLNPQQAANLQAADDQMCFHRIGGETELLRGPPPVVRLDQLQLLPVSHRRDTDPIHGECSYSVDADLHVPYAGMMTYELGALAHVTNWCYPYEPLQSPGGTLHLNFSSIRDPNDPQAQAWKGTTVVFVRLTLTVDPKEGGGRLPISNVCAALLDVN
jgi:hypothetical protein